MTKTIKQIDLFSVGLLDAEANPKFLITEPEKLLRVTGEIMLYSDKDKIFMGDFYAKNLVSHREYNAYWLKMPTEIFSDLNYLRGKNYNIVTSNSPIAFILKTDITDKVSHRKFVYSIELLHTLDR